jgi:hypothetical protein
MKRYFISINITNTHDFIEPPGNVTVTPDGAAQGIGGARTGQPHYEVSRKDADNTFLQQKGVIFGFSIMKSVFLAVFLYSKPEGKYRVKEW